MKLLASALAVLACASTFALAAGTEPGAPKDKPITVGELINVGNALRQLKTYNALDKDGKSISLPYRFSGETLFAMSIDTQAADAAMKAYQEAHDALIRQLSDGKDKVSDDKLAEYKIQAEKMFNAPSGALLSYIKRESLCLDIAPPACPVANPIPIDVLTLMLPIIRQ